MIPCEDCFCLLEAKVVTLNPLIAWPISTTRGFSVFMQKCDAFQPRNVLSSTALLNRFDLWLEAESVLQMSRPRPSGQVEHFLFGGCLLEA